MYYSYCKCVRSQLRAFRGTRFYNMRYVVVKLNGRQMGPQILNRKRYLDAVFVSLKEYCVLLREIISDFKVYKYKSFGRKRSMDYIYNG